jgi:Tol biopolymer transport system component
VDSRERRSLTSPANAGEDDLRPAFSPDGRSVAFVRTEVSATSIYRIPVTGGNPIRIARPGMPSAGLVWSPDGGYLLFATGRLAPGLLVVPAGARDATQLQRLDIAGFNVHDPSIVSKDGGREVDLAYAQKSMNWDIWGASIGNHVSTPVLLAASNRSDDGPKFSPDGKRIVFSSSRTGYEEIWVSMADGAMARQLTHFKSAVTSSPRWSPDGGWIAFESTVNDNPDIYLVRGDGSAPIRVTSEPSAEVQPSWSQDGRWLYFMSDRGGNGQIWKTPVEGGRAVQVTRHGGFQAVESDDGRFVYYTREGRGFYTTEERGRGIWRVPANGGPETSFSDKPYQDFWTLAGGGLYYLDVKGRMPYLFTIPGLVPVRRIDLATNRTTTVASVEASFPGGVSLLDVTRDGKQMAWVGWRERSTELILIRNLHIAP